MMSAVDHGADTARADLAGKITELLGQGLSWKQIGKRIGVVDPGDGLRFTPEEDQYLCAEWPKNTRIETMAKHLQRSAVAVQQRIKKLRSCGQLGKRDRSKTHLVRRFGAHVLSLGDTPAEIKARLAEAEEGARLAARLAVRGAKETRVRAALDRMHQSIAAGRDRNEAIYDCRAEGVGTERLGAEFNISHVRIWQICKETALRRSLAVQASNGAA